MAEIGHVLEWTPAQRPGRTQLRGSHVLLRPVDPQADAEPLYSASRDPGNWTYLPDGPYHSPGELERMLSWAEGSDDPLYFALATLPGEHRAGSASALTTTPGPPRPPPPPATPRDRNRAHLVRPPTPPHHRRHGGDLPARPPRLRRAR